MHFWGDDWFKKRDGERVVELNKAQLMWTDIRERGNGFNFENQLELLESFFNNAL
jgi:hypothetical protein